MSKRQIYKRKNEKSQKIAREHIASLLDRAKSVAGSNMGLACRYVTLARKVAMRYRIRMSSEQKRLFCPHCYRFLLPGKNLRVRIHESRVIYYCLDCKKFWRKPVK